MCLHTFILRRVGLKGKTCLLRTICEVAEIPMDVENSNSLIENIVHYIFTYVYIKLYFTTFLNINFTGHRKITLQKCFKITVSLSTTNIYKQNN